MFSPVIKHEITKPGVKVGNEELERFKIIRFKVDITGCVQFYASSVMGDVLSTNLSNLDDIFTSPDWSPPSAIYSNFNFSTWSIPSFPAVPSGNQVLRNRFFKQHICPLSGFKVSNNIFTFIFLDAFNFYFIKLFIQIF